MDGATTADTVVVEFTTARPTVSYTYFTTWRHPGVPVMLVAFNQWVTKASVESSARFAILGGDRETRVRAVADSDDLALPLDTEPGPGGDAPDEARREWYVAPVDELPLDSDVALHFEAGLASTHGPERGAARRNVVRFQTFPEFQFLGVRCTDNQHEEVLIAPGATNTPPARCDPLGPISLSFSAPVLASEIKREIVIDPDLAGGRDDYDPWARRRDRTRIGQARRDDETYNIPLPERLQAFQRYEVHSRRSILERLAAWWSDGPETNIRDEFGRPLAKAVDLTFWTDHRRADFKLTHRDAVLESAIDSEVPLYVTNLDAVHIDYRRLGETKTLDGLPRSLRPADVDDVSFAIPLGVREMTGGETGAVYGRLSSTSPSVVKSPPQHRFFAQVTPYQVHAKFGHFNTLVWVKDLASGEPVANAGVAIYRDELSDLGEPPADAASARTDAQGTALLPGAKTLDPERETFGWRCRKQDQDDCERLFVRVDGERGMALLPLAADYRVDVGRASKYRIRPAPKPEHGHIRAWGATAQGVYRAGDVVDYKIYVRDQNNEQFVPAKTDGYTLELVDPTGKTVHQVENIVLNEFGALHGEYAVPETGVMGWHRFVLKAEYAGKRTWRPMRVLITDFTPSAFAVRSDLNGDLFRRGDTLVVETAATLHSGGPYTEAETRVTVALRPRRFSSDHPTARDFHFDSSPRTGELHLHQEIGYLTAEGRHTTRLDVVHDGVVFGQLQVESAVRDDRGKYVTARAVADYVGIDRLVGLRKDKWVFDANEEAEILVLVVDERGELVADTEAVVAVARLVTKAARVKGAGNAYLTHFTESWQPVANCAGTPTETPLRCRFIPEQPGRYRVKARIEDSQGRPHITQLFAWVAGKGQVVWRQEAGHAMELVPEQQEYRVGDTARFLLKNPFPGTTALATLERYGVIRQWQIPLPGSTPILEFPIEPEYVPGAYLSVVAFSPRVHSPPPENAAGGGEIDLGKPAFRIGYAEIPVADPYKQLAVDVATDRAVYKPRQTVAVELKAEPSNPPASGDREPVEFAVAVLDEAVFDLIGAGRSYFDPYRGFYSADQLDVENYSLLTRIVGRQRFEKKGANSGGDGGGALDLRSILEFVGYWNPSLPADADGRASFEFTLPDNLTGWRVLAMAATPSDRFGLGDANFKTNQPTEIRPVMPNQVTEEDRFQAGFSVMNRTELPRTLTVTIDAEGDIAGAATRQSQELTLAPYGRETVYLPVVAARLGESRDAPPGAVRFEVRAGDGADGDALAHEVPVRRHRSLEVAAHYGTVVDTGVTEPVAFPPDIHADAGDVSVVLSATVIGNVDGAFRYMRDYPYLCWEQVLSKGVMASHFNSLRAYLEPSLDWPNSAALPAATLARAASYQAPNGGMSYWLPLDSHVSPYLSAYTALAFNWLRDAGHEVPAPVETKLHGYLERLLRRDEMPSFFSRGMSSTVRAVALNALAARSEATSADLERYAEHVRYMDLFGAANFLDAALRAGGADALTAPAMNHILSRRSVSGGKLAFNEETVDTGHSRILTTQLRSNCALLSALSRLEDPGARGLDANAAVAMVRAITQTRGNRDHWENTQENLFCMNALVDYAKRWEDVEPALRVTAALDGTALGEGRFDGFRDPPLRFSTPITAAHPGTTAGIAIRRQGVGRLYYAARVAYSPKLEMRERVGAGIDVRREYAVQRDGEWVLLDDPATVARGELLRVDLFLDLPTARNFVVVDDPVPGGLEPVDRNLATASGVDAREGDFPAAGGSWWHEFGDWRGLRRIEMELLSPGAAARRGALLFRLPASRPLPPRLHRASHRRRGLRGASRPCRRNVRHRHLREDQAATADRSGCAVTPAPGAA